MDVETKGERAAQILENEVYKEAVDGARQRLKDDWAQSNNADIRESLWHKLRAIDAVTTELKIIRDRGIFARNENEKETAS